MRGTTKITNNNALYFINRNFTNYSKVNNQLSLFQQVINLEDNPLAANIGIKLTNIISRTEQYNRSIQTGVGALGLTDGYLTSCKTIMDSVKTLTVGAANDATTPQQRAANAIEMNQIMQQLVLSGNAFDGSRYILGGQNTTTPPFEIVNGAYVNYTGDDKDINILVDAKTSMAINSTGTDAYGDMITTISSRDLNPDVTLSTDRSTRLADLNGGSGVPKGKIMVHYSAYPDGLEVDLSGCDTLEDVKDAIEKQTLDASRLLDTAQHPWLDATNLNWHDLQDRYVKVTINPGHNGISLQEFDLGEPLPEPTVYEQRRNMAYDNSVNPGYYAGGLGVAGNPPGSGELVIYNQEDCVYNTGRTYAPLRVDEVANNKVAEALGIKGTANEYHPTISAPNGDPAMDGFIHGRDLNPRLSERTLLADLEGYNDSVYTFTNGAKPGAIAISETTQDSGNVFNDWNLSGLAKGGNTGSEGELYARAVNRGTATAPEIHVEIYSRPLSSAKASDLVATGVYNDGGGGGTVILEEANSSGLSGTVGIVLPQTVNEASVSLEIDFGQTLQASVHVPAFVEETDANGQSKDLLDIASGWQIRGLDKPPADGYDENHVFSTDLDGDVSVNYRFDAAGCCFRVELSRPSFKDQPAKLIATATLSLANQVVLADAGPPPVYNLANCASGRIEFIGAPGFEGVKGSVYIELPANSNFAAASSNMGSDPDNAVVNTYQLYADAPAGSIRFGGAAELVEDQDIDSAIPITLKADTLFKAGQTFTQDVAFPNGYVLPAGTPMDKDAMLPRGMTINAAVLQAGTVIAEGQTITFTGDLAAGTVIPRGSHYTDGNVFPSEGMSIVSTNINPYTGQPVSQPDSNVPMGHDLRATFATIEDFNRAVEQSGVYVASRVSEDGKELEFRSSLAGAWLTVSEDTDCYEQMGDQYQQLSGLDFNGIVKGVNSDQEGNLYTEVAYYPPDPLHPELKVKLIADNGEIVEIDPGYYVRVYKDKAELEKTYENRDNSLMVAEGFVPAGSWNPAWSVDNTTTPPTPPTGVPAFVPKSPLNTIGTMPNLILEERNDSGVSGHVDFDYYGTRQEQVLIEPTILPDNTIGYNLNYDVWKNDDITVFPGGLRPEGSVHTTIQEWDMENILPGVTCDYAGTFHGVITKSADPEVSDLRLYKDASHTVMTSRSLPGKTPVTSTDVYGNIVTYDYADARGNIILYEVDRYGELALDAEGHYIRAGSLAVARNDLLDGQSDDFVLTTGGNRNYGQEREDNVFSTINDIIDALHQNDVEKLHDLIGTITTDIDRILAAVGDVGARTQSMNLLSERHADDIVRFTGAITQRVGMDDQALAKAVLDFQAAQNAYQAAMQVSAQIMQMSLLSYL
ncbi:MAG: hypothetical protein LBU23_09370 [Planctomycetota bacterium]|jgi:flagellin-like hook-associated protein FlgL|nr:hypothetical protein [Planctomycetota bacterium]